MYKLSTRDIEALSKFNMQERQHLMALAAEKLNAVEKLALNLIKLLILLPIFVFISQQSWLFTCVALLGAISAYILILKPLTLFFSTKYLDKEIKRFEASQAD